MSTVNYTRLTVFAPAGASPFARSRSARMRPRANATFCAAVIFLKSGEPSEVIGKPLGAGSTFFATAEPAGFAASFAFVEDPANDTLEPVPA